MQGQLLETLPGLHGSAAVAAIGRSRGGGFPWLLIGLLIVHVAWLSSLEDLLGSSAVTALQYCAVGGLSGALIIQTVAVMTRAQHWERGLAFVASLCLVVIALLSTSTFCVAGRYAPLVTWRDEEIREASSLSTAELARRYTILEQRAGLLVIGKPRSVWRRFRAVVPATSTHSRVLGLLRRVLPPHFAEYAVLIDSGLRLAPPDEVGAVRLLSAYCSWRYPQYVPLVIWQSGSSISALPFEENPHPDGSGVYPVHPFLGELFGGRLGVRLGYYQRVFAGLYHSPFFRTDLRDDPYFLFARGEFDGARAGLANLPADRRHLLEQLLNGKMKSD
jgi:hypothetical protein